MIVTAIVVVVVLEIVLLAVNAVTLCFLGMVQPVALLLGDDAIRLGLRLQILDVRLAIFEAHRFIRSQTARCDTLLDACLLIDLPLIDARCVGLRHGQHGQTQAKNSNDPDAFHIYLLFAG